MPATGSVYTQNTSFGVSNGPIYQGQIVVPAVATGTENYRNYSAQVLKTAALQVVDALGFVFANWLAMGFIMVLDPVQTGAPTPAQLLAATVTIHLTDAGTAAADFEIVLGAGQSMSWVVAPVGLNSDAASITIDGDANCDCDVYGLLLLLA